MEKYINQTTNNIVKNKKKVQGRAQAPPVL